MLICCIGFGREANARRRRSSVTFVGTTEPDVLKVRLVKRIQERRQIKRDPPEKSVSLRYGMTNWNIRTGGGGS